MAKKQKVTDDPMSQCAVTAKASSMPSQLELATPSFDVPTTAAASEGVFVYV